MRLVFAAALALSLLAGPAHAGKAKARHHVVVKGDTLSEIAAAHEVTVDDLRRWNGIEGDTIRLGQTLRLGPTGQKYRVRRGDTLSQIAAHRGTTVNTILALNPGLKPNRLKRGETILVPRPKVEPPPRKMPLACPGKIVQIKSQQTYRVRNRRFAWATAYTADAIRRGFTMVRQRHGSAVRARVLDASRKSGGQLGHHLSHRTGRDVDITYFQESCGRAGCPVIDCRPERLDVKRQWTLFRYWLDNDDVEYLFVDHSLQKVLYEHAKKEGATEEQLKEWFQYPRSTSARTGIIRDWPGHRNHVHVRFREAPCEDGCCEGPKLAKR